MKRRVLFTLIFITISSLSSLTNEEKTKNFEKLWRSVKEQYPYFERKNIDWDEVYKKYRPIVEKSIDDEEYILILKNMLAELDDGHADIINPSLQLEGIGAVIKEEDNRVIVSYVLKDSPSEISGLKKGSEILEVNSSSVSNYINSLPVYFKKPRWRLRTLLFHGKANTPISIAFKDPDNGIKKVEIKRLKKLKSHIENKISYKYLNDEIGYIRIPKFSDEKIVKDFNKALKDLFKSKGLIIDVRGNPGGSSEISNGIVGRFINERIKIGTSIYKKPKYISGKGFKNVFDYIINPRGKTYKKPVVIIIDFWCASACELFAISMKDSARALLVGRKTAGVMGLPGNVKLSGGIVARFSTGDFIRLSGESVEDRGITPDIHVDNEDEDIGKAIEIVKWTISTIKKNNK